MRDGNPHLLRRMLMLRQFPLFVHADLGELANVAENVVERSFAAGDVVAPAEYSSSLQLVVDGRVSHGALELGPRHVHGALEALAARASAAPAIAIAPTRTLELVDYLEVLEDNFGLMLGAVRELASRMIPLGIHGRAHPFHEGATLGLVERMIVLRQQPAFAGARLEALAILAHAAVETRWPAGAIIRRAGALADGALILLEGSLQSDARALAPGHAVGTLETLAALHHAATYEAATPVRMLVSHAATIHDVLEDHSDFALAMLKTFARSLLDDSRTVCALRSHHAEAAQPAVTAEDMHWRTS